MSWFSRFFSSGRSRSENILGPDLRKRLDAWRQLPPPDLEACHHNMRYVIVDVESSGLNMKKDCLISIGALSLSGGQIDFKDAFQVILRQEQVSTHENILIHGIGGGAQKEGTDPAEALIAFLEYAGQSPLIAYHAFFDQSMINKAMKKFLGEVPELPWIDLAWVLPDLFHFKTDGRVQLDDWLQYFDIENILRHNAVSDAYATAKLMQICTTHGTRKGADSPARFMKIEKARRWMFESR